jgi:uncharacterized membrane protein YuzA (DUF378 family)
MQVCKKVYLDMIIKYIVILGAINWGVVGLLRINLVDNVSRLLNKNVNHIVYIIIAACGVYLLLNRNTYLPFLGEAAFPVPLENKAPVQKGEQLLAELTDLPPNNIIESYIIPIIPAQRPPNKTNSKEPGPPKVSVIIETPLSANFDPALTRTSTILRIGLRQIDKSISILS